MHIRKFCCTFAALNGFVVRDLRYILLVLIIGLCASVHMSDLSAQDTASCPSASASAAPSVLNDISEDYAKRLQQQYDWTDALTSCQIGTRSEDNRLRTRRQERVSTSWQLRTNTQQLCAALRYHANSISHNINRIVALSCTTPLSLPTEHISFPFHSFW